MMKKLLAAVIVLNFISFTAIAQIIADPNAPGSQRPTLLHSANGVPQVDITTPSAGGVSINQFRQFDISPQGVVINNGFHPSQTQLAGWIAANPWLAGGSAKVIIHQINSTHPSTLQGYIEIGGNKADFILANPAGITCRGCGFLNAAQVQLATGKPQFQNGQPSGFAIGPGSIHIDGAGMDASRTALAELITREARINAGLWANQLRVALSGPPDNGTTAATTDQTASPPPVYALDVSRLGGMVAGRIWLIGTAHGLGVRNAGTLAGVDEFSLSLDGTLTNRGHIEAARVSLRTTTLDNLGSGTIIGERVTIGAERVNNIGEEGASPLIAAANTLAIGAQQIHNRQHALLYSAGDLHLGGALNAQQQFSGHAALIHNASASIEALGDMQIASERFANTNENFATVIEKISGPTSQFYLQPNGAAEKILGEHFRWQPWSRAGLYRWKTNNADSDTSILGQTPIPQISVEDCVSDAGQEVCTPTPNTSYPRTDPAWAYFKLPAPELEPVAPTLDKPLPPVLTKPIEPDPASDLDGSKRALWKTQQADYDRALAHYEQQLATYDSVMSQFAQAQQDWQHQTDARMDALESAIVRYNAGFAGAEITAWTQFHVTHTELQSQVTASDPARLTAGGNLRLQGGHFINDKSRITAGDTLSAQLKQLDNIDAIGQHIVQESGTSQHTQSRWRGGFKRYHQRDWGPVLSYAPADVVTSISLPITALPAGTDTGTDPVTALSLWNARTLGGPNILFHSSDDLLRPLIETDPRFVQYRQWLSSDAMQNQLRNQPATTQKQLGDAYLEQRLVREHIAELTGRRFLPGQHNWIQRAGTLIAADSIELTLKDTLHNSGNVAADKQLVIEATTVNNGGTLSADQLTATTNADINNLGGRIQAQRALTLDAGGDINIASTTHSSSKQTRERSLTQSSRTNLDRIAEINVTDPNGQLHLEAERDINVDAARLTNAGDGITQLTAGRDLNFGTRTTASQTASVRAGDDANYLREGNSKEVGTRLQAAGDITLIAKGNLNARAASVTSDHGKLDVAAQGDINLVAGSASNEFAQGSRITSSGLLGSRTTTKREERVSTEVEQTVFSAEQLHVHSGGSATVQGSRLVSGSGTELTASRDIVIESATSTRSASSYRQEKESGLLGGPGLSVTIGSRTTDTASQSTSTTNVGSMVGAIDGNVDITVGKAYRQTASTVMSPSGSVAIDAQRIIINAGTDTAQTSQQTRTKQTGLTLAISNPVISAAQTLDQLKSAASSTKDSRAQAMAASAAALTVANTAATVAADPGHAGGVTASLTLGTSQSQSASTQSLTTAATSNVAAAQDIRLSARTAEKDSKEAKDAATLSITSSQIQAGRKVELQTDSDLQLKAATNTASQRSSNSSTSTAVGVAVTFGAKPSVGVALSGSAGRGNADGDDLSWTPTQIQAGQQITAQSGGHTTITGATLSAEQVDLQVGGNLNITSVQDTSRYQSAQKSVSGSATIGPASSANVNLNKQHVDSDYASVNQQSGIQAGDGGFTVAVNDTTTLTGGAITSSEQAVQQNKNSFTTGRLVTSDLNNRAHYQAQAVGVSIGAGTSTSGGLVPGGTSAGVGNASGSASSTTQSAISGIAGNKAARTGDASTEIAKIFDAATVEQDVGAQVVIMQTFTREAPKAVANYADSQAAALNKQLNQETDSSKQAALQAELGKWKEGGAYRVALHAATGAIAGGIEGAIGAGSVAAAAPMLTDLQNTVVDKLRAAGVNETVAKGAAQVMATSAAAAVGAATTGGSAQGAAVGMGVDANNRQLHQGGRDWAKKNAKKYQEYLGDNTGEKISAEDAYQRLLSAGYAMMDDAATKGGKSDESAKQFINGNAPENMFKANVAERANPFLGGNPDGSFTPEQQARFGTSKPGEQASAAVTNAMRYVGQPCSDCRNKAAAIDNAVMKLQEARVLYQDDPGSVKLIDQQIDQLKTGITRDELARGMAGVISDKDKGIVALMLGTPTRTVMGTTTSGLLDRVAMTQAGKVEVATADVARAKGLETVRGIPKNLEGLADTNSIRFTQNSIKGTFKDGTSMQKTIDALRSGKLSTNDLPPIRVFEQDGVVYTLDNRRLFVANQAGIPIKIVPATPAEVAKEIGNKMTTPNGGTIICLRNGCIQ